MLSPVHKLGTATTAALLAVGLIAGIAHYSRAAEPAAAAAPLMRHNGAQIEIPSSSPLRRDVVVAVVGQSSAPHTLELPGIVEADPATTVNVLPPVAGHLVTLAVRLGDTVHAGQLLATLTSADLAQAVSDAEKARDALKLADQALARARGVNEAGANAQKDIEQAQSNQVQAASEMRRAEQRLTALGFNGEHGRAEGGIEIHAPIGGSVTGLMVGINAFVNDPTQPIMTISNLDPIWVTASVPEAQAGAVARGDSADIRLNAWPGQVLHGKVAFVGAVLDPDTRRARARIVLPNHDARLKPNMYATVALALPQQAAVTVPASALLMNNDQVTVFVEVKPFVFERRVVEIGSEDGEAVRVRSGLAAGERVIVKGGVLLND